MKSRITSLLFSFSVITVSISLTAAQETSPSPTTIRVGSGNDLRCRLDKSLRITKPGEQITARLVEPVYIGTTLAIPEGATLQGHVSSISTAPLNKRTGRLLRGDLTPPRTPSVTFDRLILSDGSSLPIHTSEMVGVSGMKTSQYLRKSQRPGVRQKLSNAAEPLREPNKLLRLREAAIKTLPYHPEYLDQGTIFDTTLLDPITTSAPVQPIASVHTPPGDNYLRLRLLTPLSSQMIARGASIEAAVSRPFYNSDHLLLYPAGTKLQGTVNKARPADWMKKNGALLFSFHSALTPDGTSSNVDATVVAVEAAGYQNLVVGQEGDVKATTSLFTKLRAPLSLIGPSRAVSDPTVEKTAWSRAGQGNKGFGLLGAGAAQASVGTAIGFGYFGAAMRVYNAFIARGSNVELPANTPILLHVADKPQSSNLSKSQPVPF